MKGMLLAIALATAAMADLTKTVTFGNDTYLNLDTGDQTSTPGSGTYDLHWSNLTMAPLGKAQIVNIGIRTASQFDLITASDIKLRLAAGSERSIASSSLVIGDVFYCGTTTGNLTKLFVQRATGGVLALNFVTYQGASTAAGAPTVTAVLNNSSLIANGLPNAGIAPSSLFIVRGTGLADAGAPVLQSSAPPGLPLTLNGASLAVTVGGVTTHPALYYTSPTQVAAVLPAGTPVGSGTLTATYNGVASAPFTITVLRAAPGINVYGTNSAVATDPATGDVFGFTHSAAPGQTIVLWATGLGADSADSDTTFTASPHAVNAGIQVYFGGIAGQILYQGSAGYPGVNQINVVVPDAVATGCWAPVALVAGTVASNIATLPVNRGGGECVDTVTGYRGSQLAAAGRASFRAGFVSLFLSNTPASNNTRSIEYTTTADFARYTGATYDPANQLSPGGCIIRQAQPQVSGPAGLDAGSLTLTGPGGLSVPMALQFGITGAYAGTLPTIPASGGTYTWTGTGGAAVGSFTSTVTLASPLLTWTNPSAAASVSPGAGLKVTWTGGNPGSWVLINGATALHANGVTVAGSYDCLEHVEAGQFTVPSYILSALPAGAGSTQVSNLIYFPLSASGLDISTGLASIGYTVTTSPPVATR